MTYDHPTAFWKWGDEEAQAMARVIASGQFTCGPEVAAFEAEFAAFHGMKHCIMVGSGSAANLVSVAALFNLDVNPLRRGDIALVPAVAWSTTYAPLIQHGLNIVLADVDETWCADPYTNIAVRTLTPPRLYVGCSILGNPGYLSGWKSRAEWSDAYFIEDNAESPGAATWARNQRGYGTDFGVPGELCGTFGLMNTFSFFITHQLSAIEGGAILTNDDECNTLCRQLRAYGWTKDTHDPAKFEDEYDFRLMGYNCKPTEMHAAIAREQLKKLPEFRAARVANYRYFFENATELPIIPPKPNGEMNPFGIHWQFYTAELREKAVVALRANGIDCRLPTGGSVRLHKYGKCFENQFTPEADKIHQRGIFCGNAPWDIPDKLDKVISVLRKSL